MGKTKPRRTGKSAAARNGRVKPTAPQFADEATFRRLSNVAGRALLGTVQVGTAIMQSKIADAREAAHGLANVLSDWPHTLRLFAEVLSIVQPDLRSKVKIVEVTERDCHSACFRLAHNALDAIWRSATDNAPLVWLNPLRAEITGFNPSTGEMKVLGPTSFNAAELMTDGRMKESLSALRDYFSGYLEGVARIHVDPILDRLANECAAVCEKLRSHKPKSAAHSLTNGEWHPNAATKKIIADLRKGLDVNSLVRKYNTSAGNVRKIRSIARKHGHLPNSAK